jgi:hypothetical protein
MDPKSVAKLLPADRLDKIVPTRSECGMDEETAVIIARRVFIQLYRGSIEQAREALEDGWAGLVGDSAPLPEGRELLAVPLARVLANSGTGTGYGTSVRILNMLEGAGIRTVNDLLNTSQAELLLIPNLGHTALLTLVRLGRDLQQQIEAKRSPNRHSVGTRRSR